MNESPFGKAAEEAAAFQKMYLESISKAFEAAFKLKPEAAPPELLKQIRAGIVQALADSWDEFLRSPQFLEGMRQWMENAITFRKMTNEFMGRVRNEAQAPSRNDIDTVMLAVSHLEKRLLDRLEEMAAQIEKLNGAAVTSPKAGNSRSNVRKRARHGVCTGKERSR